MIYSELGRIAGVATPTIDHIIRLASIALGRDLRADGMTLERIGLGGLGKDEFLHILENGFSD